MFLLVEETLLEYIPFCIPYAGFLDYYDNVAFALD